MAWFKVDDKLWGHPKWLATPTRARGLWVTAGSWSASNETDGRIPAHVLPTLMGTKSDANALVQSGLWVAELSGDYRFHGWAEFQPTRADLNSKREAERQRKADWRARKADRPAGVPDVSQRDTHVSPAGVP